MKYITLKRGLMGLGVIGVFWFSDYISKSRTYTLEELSSFLSNCGASIQTGFQSGRPMYLDYLIVVLSVIVVLITLWYSVKYLVQPNEAYDHVKYQILDDEKKR